MPEAAQTGLLPALEVAHTTPLTTATNGLRYASFGYTEIPSDSLKHIVEAVPSAIAASLAQRAYYFVPLAIGETEETEIARGFTLDLADRAACHRNVLADHVLTDTAEPALSSVPKEPSLSATSWKLPIRPGTILSEPVECTFISARLMQDRFALAFEFFINIGHQLVDTIKVPRQFQDLIWAQARAEVRGETSQDAYETRVRALETSAPRPKSTSGTSPAPSDTLSIEREGPAPQPRLNANFASSLATAGSAFSRAENTNIVSLFASRDTERPRANTRGEAARQTATRSEATRSEALSPDSRNGTAAHSALVHSETEHATDDQQAFFEAAFADTLAIYMLSLAMDLDYADLREREYPLLTAPALADRLRLAATLYPPAQGYEFNIRYRRRH